MRLNEEGINRITEGRRAMPGTLGADWRAIPNNFLANLANHIANVGLFNEEKVSRLKPLAEKFHQTGRVNNSTNEDEIKLLVKAYESLTACKGWSVDTLAGVAGVSPDTVWRIERGTGVTRESFRRVTRVFGFEPDNYIEEDDLSLQKLWQRLQGQATPTDLMGAVAPPRIPTLGARPRNTPYLPTVPLGSNIKFQLNLDRAGHLILLEREPSGAVVCLCPSNYAPNTYTTGEIFTLPQYPPSPAPYLGATEAGCEQYVALLCQELPPLSWLEKSKREALELNVGHLRELMEYLDEIPDKQLYYTQYTVQAQTHI